MLLTVNFYLKLVLVSHKAYGAAQVAGPMWRVWFTAEDQGCHILESSGFFFFAVLENP